MPNYIKNRIELSGTEEQVNALIERFSTAYKEEQHKSHDDNNTYESESGEYGWLNTETNVFTRRNMADVVGVPDGFKPHMIAAWVRFPDFEKVIPMPESLRITSGSTGDAGYGILHGKSENMFMGMDEQLKRFYASSIDQRIEILEAGIAYEKNMQKHGFKTWYDWSIEFWGTKWNSSECEKISDTIFDFITAWSGVPQLIEKMSLEFPDVKISYEYSDEDTGANCGVGTYLNGEVEFRRLENHSAEAYELAFKLRPDRKEDYQLVDGKYEYVEED